MLKNFILTILTLYLISLSCLADDTNQIPSNLELSDPAEAYYNHVLLLIDGDDIPENVKKFANEHLCIQIMKSYFWSNKKYPSGDVYSCAIHGKLKYIIVKNNKIHFSHWYQNKRLNKTIYDN